MERQNQNRSTVAHNHKPECACGLCVRLQAQAATAAQKELAGRKVRRRITPRKRRFVQEFSDPSSPGHRNATAAARLAGYSPDSADDIGPQLLRSSQVQELIGKEMERPGITSDLSMKSLKDGLQAEEVKLTTKNGLFSDERGVPDWHARVKYQEMAHSLRGDMQKEPVVQKAALMMIRLPNEADAETSGGVLHPAISKRRGLAMTCPMCREEVQAVCEECGHCLECCRCDEGSAGEGPD
jgi:phage terminase small subunit